MDRVDVAMGELFARYIQLELGTTYDPPAPAEAERLKTSIKDWEAQRRAGTLDGRAFVAWAAARVPWLARQLGDVSEPPRRVWTPPPAVPAPTPAHAAVAQRIVRGDRRPQE
jgi:hypothetical protein